MVRKFGKSDGQTGSRCLDKAVLAQKGGGGTAVGLHAQGNAAAEPHVHPPHPRPADGHGGRALSAANVVSAGGSAPHILKISCGPFFFPARDPPMSIKHLAPHTSMTSRRYSHRNRGQRTGQNEWHADGTVRVAYGGGTAKQPCQRHNKKLASSPTAIVLRAWGKNNRCSRGQERKPHRVAGFRAGAHKDLFVAAA